MLYIYPTLLKQQARSHGKQPTGSVRVKITAGEKKSVLEVFRRHSDFYKEYPDFITNIMIELVTTVLHTLHHNHSRY